MTGPPACPVMADRHGMIAAPAVEHAQISELRHGEIAASQTVDDDLALRVKRPYRRDRSPDQRGVILAGQAILSRTRWFVDQIKAEKFGRNILVAASKGFPQKYKCILGDRIAPKIVLFEIVAIGTVTGGTMQIQRHVDAA